MSQNSLVQLKEGPFIEIFRLEDINDSVFANYQRYDFFQLIWFTKVEGVPSYFVDFDEYTLEENRIVLVFPGQIDMLHTAGKKGYLFAIERHVFFDISKRLNSDYLNGFFPTLFLEPDTETKRLLETIIDLLFREYGGENRLLLMTSYMEAFLFHVSALSDNTDLMNNENVHLAGELMQLIDHHFIHQRETDFYARELGVSNKKVNLISTKGTGKTVKQHIQERLVLEIKKEIRLGEKSFKEIAFELGFSEAAYFTRFFKQQTGLTPGQFKENG